MIYTLRSIQTIKGNEDNKNFLIKELEKDPDLLLTFKLTCKTNDAKLINISLSCLHQLIMSRAIPKKLVKDILGILKDSLEAGYEIQLKILQILLSFFTVFNEVYEEDIYEVYKIIFN